jgi:hypothetical protein
MAHGISAPSTTRLEYVGSLLISLPGQGPCCAIPSADRCHELAQGSAMRRAEAPFDFAGVGSAAAAWTMAGLLGVALTIDGDLGVDLGSTS